MCKNKLHICWQPLSTEFSEQDIKCASVNCTFIDNLCQKNSMNTVLKCTK